MHCCPLCNASPLQLYHQDKRREYLQCLRCDLVSVAPSYRLDAEAEKSIYDLHENHPSDPGYRQFLSRLFLPLNQRLLPDSSGLDYGCGPGPTLSLMLEEAGHRVALYDIFYHHNVSALSSVYDFITATEVIEHLYHPGDVWQQWLKMLKPGGYIGLMTKLVENQDAFSTWHYKNDLTHVSFFSQKTFRYLAERDKLEPEFIGRDVIILRKGLS
ncbi:class I SAM-dependent methyltransferase [Vibrio quintilis]|uniref:Methyltransferase domain protein n=1 Tax=Vibrio quintilis TaxID=1117707 RepID=A0A1M7YSC5_9VIBR|nr:class I SAM-dependent methyltransferase [Vibrio quintilis]SHO55519.1 Methyltransferase domain protein [Vibrio quintilis]